MQYLYRNATNDYRFSLQQLAQGLGLLVGSPAQYGALRAQALDMGATYIGKARTNLPNGGQVTKDNVYAVPAAHWQTWLAYMRSPQPATPRPAQQPAPHLAVYGTQAQLAAVQAVCQALGAQCAVKS